ncbi:MAG: plasma-membrane proton-efflux P-type ATPase [Rhodospirillales bacterium]|nr:plasma-membrane proton-efflux P-type ATPase [Rhodospirillales bacterium]
MAVSTEPREARQRPATDAAAERLRLERQDPAELFAALQSTPAGLAAAEAAARLGRYGPNAVDDQRTSLLLQFLGYFWGPIPWMIEIAAALSAVIRHWPDLIIILVLLGFNALVGFWEEYQAGNAIAQLKKSLALKARARRDGAWQEIDARDLVPGDVVRLRLGAIIPADVKLFDGDYLSVDQSALTGESLPVDKKIGNLAYSGSVAKQGTMLGLVVATGMRTFFGQTARLVSEARHVSHFQKAVIAIGRYLIHFSLALIALLVAVELIRGERIFTIVEFALVLAVASIPVALPAVLSVTMAVGALVLSRMKAIVSHLDSIEEMAGMDVLCSDKTGTLTQNRLTLGEPACIEGVTPQELILAATLASPADDRDAIDAAVAAGLADPAAARGYVQKKFVPFDPVRKRTEAELAGPDGRDFQVAKGAPQVILDMAAPGLEERRRIERQVEGFAARGDRTLGVARRDGGAAWRFLGLLPLADPPRADAAETIAQARAHGLAVKMVTGDNVAIGRQIGAQIGLGGNILAADALATDSGGDALDPASVRKVEAADGFAQVFPAHKFAIVKALQAAGHLVGMTGDGVNDAPALKQADMGIAVSGATDAARAAADLVLTAPGLDVIIRAVEEARRIFERMNAYAIYRITETIRITLFVVLSILIYDFYPITTVLIILLALLNDLPIMTIAYDNAWLSPAPVRWRMRRVLTVASTLGLIGVIETFGLLIIALRFFDFSQGQIQSLIFLKLSVAGHLTLFVARTRQRVFQPPYPARVLLLAILGTQAIAALIVGLGLFVAAVPWADVGAVWIYCLVWMLIEDEAKMLVYRFLEPAGTGKPGPGTKGQERKIVT